MPGREEKVKENTGKTTDLQSQNLERHRETGVPKEKKRKEEKQMGALSDLTKRIVPTPGGKKDGETDQRD